VYWEYIFFGTYCYIKCILKSQKYHRKVYINKVLRTSWTCYSWSDTETVLSRMGLDKRRHSDNSVNCMKVTKVQHTDVYLILKLSAKFNELSSIA